MTLILTDNLHMPGQLYLHDHVALPGSSTAHALYGVLCFFTCTLNEWQNETRNFRHRPSSVLQADTQARVLCEPRRRGLPAARCSLIVPARQSSSTGSLLNAPCTGTRRCRGAELSCLGVGGYGSPYGRAGRSGMNCSAHGSCCAPGATRIGQSL
jgi:hypothetical protein